MCIRDRSFVLYNEVLKYLIVFFINSGTSKVYSHNWTYEWPPLSVLVLWSCLPKYSLVLYIVIPTSVPWYSLSSIIQQLSTYYSFWYLIIINLVSVITRLMPVVSHLSSHLHGLRSLPILEIMPSIGDQQLSLSMDVYSLAAQGQSFITCPIQMPASTQFVTFAFSSK